MMHNMPAISDVEIPFHNAPSRQCLPRVAQSHVCDARCQETVLHAPRHILSRCCRPAGSSTSCTALRSATQAAAKRYNRQEPRSTVGPAGLAALCGRSDAMPLTVSMAHWCCLSIHEACADSAEVGTSPFSLHPLHGCREKDELVVELWDAVRIAGGPTVADPHLYAAAYQPPMVRLFPLPPLPPGTETAVERCHTLSCTRDCCREVCYKLLARRSTSCCRLVMPCARVRLGRLPRALVCAQLQVETTWT